MSRLSRFPLERRALVLACAALLVVCGVVAWRQLPIDAFPDVTNVQTMILAAAPGLAAEDVERQVAYPIEQRLGGLPRVTQVRSLSKAGIAQVVVVFEDGVDPYFGRQLVFERLAGIKEALPAGVDPKLAPLSTGLGEIFQYTLEGSSISPMEKRAVQDWLVAPQLRTTPGVAEVNSFGGFVKQYQVLVDPARLAKYGATLRDVTELLERDNRAVGGGYIVKGWEQAYIRGDGLFRAPEDIAQLVLRAKDGVPVRIGDVADVVVGPEPRQGATTRDGKGETVAGMAIMLRGANAQTVVGRIKDTVARIQRALPPGLRIDVFYDRTELVQACIATVRDALLEGTVFVVLVLFLFVAELRTALIVVLSLPITFLCTFIVMGASGLSSNLMSLGGLAFSVGMVVDASIVVVENARRRLARDEGGTKRDVVAAALAEVARPVAFSVLIIALVVVPLLTLQGMEGKMFRPLALTLVFALLASIAVALTIVPALADWLLPRAPEREFRLVRRLHAGYLRLLEGAMRRPRTTFGVAVVGLVLAAALVPFMGAEFLPSLDEGAIAINVVRLPNASLDGSVATAGMIERRLLRFPEVATVVCKTGRAEISEDPMGPEQTDVNVMLKPRREWTTGRGKAELVEAMNEDLSRIPGLRLSFSQPIALRVNELVSGVKSDLAVKVFGPDLAVLKKFADQAAVEIGAVEGARDVRVEQVSGMAQLEVAMDRAAMARYGINPGDVADLVEAGMAGRVATRFVEQERRFDVVVRYGEGARADESALRALLVPAPGGERVPLGELATIRAVEGPAQVSREQGMRRVVVEANVRGRDLGGFVADVQRRAARLETSLPPGYWVEYGGQFENQQRAMRQLAIVVPIVLLLVLFLLYSALGSLRNALLVVLNLPFALVGGVVAAVAFRMHLSVSAAVAFIVLLGVAVQNGVVLVAFFRQLRAAGHGVAETVRIGCDARFRPLLMTALTSFIGHLPMLYAVGSGADIQKPLAVIVMGGIVTSTLLTLVVLPVAYARLER